jgi:hypothetical protein
MRHSALGYDYGVRDHGSVDRNAEFLAYQADIRAQGQRFANVPAVAAPIVVPPIDPGPVPPFGFLFLSDFDGALLIDADGAFLITPA